MRTIVVALDLDLSILLNDIYNSTLLPHVKRSLSAYLHGRRAFTEFRTSKSNHRKLKLGVPQGGVLSPLHFNFYVSTLPTPPAFVTYADDCSIICSAQTVEEASMKINEYLLVIKNFLDERKLALSPHKSTATIFTSWTREVNVQLDIQIGNSLIPTVKYPKILGVTLDNLFRFAKHATETCAKLSTRNKVLRALTSTTWGKGKETIVATYKAIGRSIINYAAPIWSPELSDTQWRNLQTRQNNALRIATGCHSITHPDHLHDETSILKVQQHNILLTQQFFLTCLNPSHPTHHIASTPLPHRSIRKDFRMYFDSISSFLPENWDLPPPYAHLCLTSIRTSSVTPLIPWNVTEF